MVFENALAYTLDLNWKAPTLPIFLAFILQPLDIVFENTLACSLDLHWKSLDFTRIFGISLPNTRYSV